MNDKIIVTNLAALKAKYGAPGVSKIRAAIKKLVAADKARGFHTRLFALDGAADMKKVKALRVTDPGSPRQNKRAIDAIYTTHRPDYLLILGAIDVIPHQDLINPAYGDEDIDKYAYGDIPYACEQPYSRQAEKFIGPTRVVGRLPDLTAGKDPDYLVNLLQMAAGWKSRTRQDYSGYFAISADEWRKSTALSVQTLFGSSRDLNLSPPKGPKWTDALLAHRAHFINCHGAPADPQFYGQKGSNYPVAHQAALLAGKISEGTVAAMECCYGGELYDTGLLTSGQSGFCNTYLAEKAYGYLASSTIAYGPSEGNGAADLLCRFFLTRVLAGASLGRATLEARQEFAQNGTGLNPFEIKTLAQFSLFGDPSIHPVAAETPSTSIPSPSAPKSLLSAHARGLPATAAPVARGERRRELLKRGIFISTSRPVARRMPRGLQPGAMRKKLLQLGAAAKITKPTILSFRIVGGEAVGSPKAKRFFMAAAAKLPESEAYHVIMGRKAASHGITRITAVVAKEVDGKLVSYQTLLSR